MRSGTTKLMLRNYICILKLNEEKNNLIQNFLNLKFNIILSIFVSKKISVIKFLCFYIKIRIY